jgi:two-component system, OmpR family, copper resistance phosphate regulon response regulator CusR
MKILVVEDNRRIAQSIKTGLEQEKYVVDLAFDGTSGLDFGLSDEYDLMVLDVMLPGKSGFEVAKDIRAQNVSLPILMLTARDQIDDRVVGLDSGADDYLVKPFAFEELMARIRALTRRPKTTLPRILTVDDLSLDPVTYKVKREGQRIFLTKKEFALLEYFMRHPHQVLTKDQIISRVWSYDTQVTENTVEAFIKNLRSKIDKPFKTKAVLHTVRGFGYTLGAA